MAVNLTVPDRVDPVAGIRLGVAQAGIRYRDRDDLVLIELAEGSRVACLLTQNRFRAAPVIVAERHLASRSPRLLVINAGNANAGTGRDGIRAAEASCTHVSSLTGCDTSEVLPFSTGVIGEQLPIDRVKNGLDRAAQKMSPDNWMRAARAIMTTDTMPKIRSRCWATPGGTVHLTGMCKGAGMIRPDMATMLAFIATDADIPQPVLEAVTRRQVDKSFNAITVDGDTSTNDACAVIATGQSGVVLDNATIDEFEQALGQIMSELAQAIVRDAEGATKFVTIQVQGADSVADAKAVALTVAHSPLVKTALTASDPNWGRILAAVGRAPISSLRTDRVNLTVNGLRILHNGEPHPDYSEEKGQAAFDLEEINIDIDLQWGDRQFTAWTSDLSTEYVRINAEYRS